MLQRRELASKQREESKLEGPAAPGQQPSTISGPTKIVEPPARGLEAMMGLDDMGEIEMPDVFSDPYNVGPPGVGQPGGMTEEEMIAMAI